MVWVIWDTLQDYGMNEWKWMLKDLDEALDVAYSSMNSTVRGGSKTLLWLGVT